MKIFARRAHLESGWAHNVALTVTDGRIAALTPDSARAPEAVAVDILLPALSNLHSHSFQRAMAGMTEYRASGRESFWTWRDLMYRYLDKLTPDQIDAIAALAFMEMLEAGFAAVGEFHYVHHAPGGHSYDNVAELSHRVMAAASDTGIGLTHLPVFYAQGGLDGRALAGGQLRFGNTAERFAALVEACRGIAAGLAPDMRVGIAPHSLRAVSPDALSRTIADHAMGPIHIHIAEQEREVAEVKAHLGARPVEWLLNNAAIGPHWCLIHATHMTPEEVRRLAASGAVAGLCPITEANLGDGVFAGRDYFGAGGAFGIGSDSNIRIAMAEELRMLEYSQRLALRERNVLAPEDGSTGAALYLGAASGGARALGREAGAIAVGRLADLVAIDGDDPALCALSEAQLFDGLVFAAGGQVITDLWAGGRHVVRDGRHFLRDRIQARFRTAMRDLGKAAG